MLLYGESEWLRREQLLAEGAARSEESEASRRLLLASAHDELLEGGTVQLPEEIRRHSDLGREVIWVGMLMHIELWNPSIFERHRANRAKRLSVVAKR